MWSRSGRPKICRSGCSSGDDRASGHSGDNRGPMIDGLTKFNARSVTVAHTASMPKRDGWPVSGSAWVFMLSRWMNELKDYFLVGLLEEGRFLYVRSGVCLVNWPQSKTTPASSCSNLCLLLMPNGLYWTQETTFISSSSVFGGQRPQVLGSRNLNHYRQAFEMSLILVH